MDWVKLAREAALMVADAFHMDIRPNVDDVYEFLLVNPEAFGYPDWPADMPAKAPAEFAAAYEDAPCA